MSLCGSVCRLVVTGPGSVIRGSMFLKATVSPQLQVDELNAEVVCMCLYVVKCSATPLSHQSTQ